MIMVRVIVKILLIISVRLSIAWLQSPPRKKKKKRKVKIRVDPALLSASGAVLAEGT